MKGFFVCCLFVFLTFVSQWPRCTSLGITCLSLHLCVHARVQMSLWVHVPWGPLLSSCPSSCPSGFLRQGLSDQDPWWVRLDDQEAPGIYLSLSPQAHSTAPCRWTAPLACAGNTILNAECSLDSMSFLETCLFKTHSRGWTEQVLPLAIWALSCSIATGLASFPLCYVINSCQESDLPPLLP